MNSKAGKIVLNILSFLVGGVFLFSAYAKTLPVEDFTDTIFGRIDVSWAMASFAARFFIGLEAALGLLLLFNIFGRKKWVLYVAMLMLIVFSGYLVGLWMMQGNEVDCGCMGKMIKMTPMWSLVKNAVLLLVIIMLVAWTPTKETPGANRFSVLAALIITALPFAIYPARLPLDVLYAKSQPQQPVQNIKEGKRVLCFLSLTCSHCRHAAKIITEINKKDPSIPFYFVFSNRKTDLDVLMKDFYQDTKSEAIPHHVAGETEFVNLAGHGVPAIYFMDGEHIDRKIDLPELTEANIKNWLEKK